jgi:hypothetical protein
MTIIGADGRVTRGGDIVPVPSAPTYQGHMYARHADLAAMFGPGSASGWTVAVTGNQDVQAAVIRRDARLSRQRAGLPAAWEVLGAKGTFGPVVRALLKHRAAAGATAPGTSRSAS